MEQHIAIIPARAGSKSIKDKNLTKLNHRTLVSLAVQKAMESRVFKKIIVSTDYPRHVLGIEGADIHHSTQIIYSLRPKELAQDDTLMIDTVLYELKKQAGDEKWVWLLQPTSPFRKVEDFKKIKTALDTGEWGSVISMKPNKEYIDRTYTYKNGTAYRLKQTNYQNKQDLRTQLTRSGNFYVTTREALIDKGSFEIYPFLPYVMGGIDPETATLNELLWARKMGTNIDDSEDLELAKNIVKRGDYII